MVSQTVQLPSGYSESVQVEHPSGQLNAEIVNSQGVNPIPVAYLS